MPRQGWKVVTVREATFNKVKEQYDEESPKDEFGYGLAFSGYVTRLLEKGMKRKK